LDVNVCGLFARFLRRLSNCALFFDYGDPFWEHRKDLTAKSWLFLERLTLSYRGDTIVACLYPSAHRYMLTRYPKIPSELVPRGYYPDDFATTVSSGDEMKAALGIKGTRTVFYGGNLDYRPYRPDVLLGAAVETVRRFTGVRFVIAGSGNWLKQMQREIESQGLGKAIFTLGEIPRRDVLRWISESEICIATYAGNPTSKVYEYLAFSKPVALALGGRDTGFLTSGANCLITGLDSVQLHQAISTLLTDRDYAARLGRVGFKSMDGLTWDKVAEMRLSLMEKLVKSTRRA
jgi:glycosyltransferase involved in cell wall biosynthesis